MDGEEDTFATPGSALALLLKKGSDYVDENVDENVNENEKSQKVILKRVKMFHSLQLPTW